MNAHELKENGLDDFILETIEEVDGEERLAEREKYWIEKFDSIDPNGLNKLAGGQIGRHRGKNIEYEGEKFSSIEAATKKE